MCQDMSQRSRQSRESRWICLCYRDVMPNINPSLKDLGEIDELFQLNQFTEALEKTDALLNKFRTSDTLYLTKGICLIKTHQYEAAKSCLTTATNLNPKKPEILFQLGICHMQTGAWQEAATQFQGALKLGLDTFAIHFMQAVCFDRLGIHNKALGSIKLAIIKDSYNPDAFNQLGTIYLSLREWASARPCFEQALKLKQTTVSLSNLAITQVMLGEPDAAIESIRKSLQIDPSDANAHNTLGNIYMEKGDILNALDCFNTATTIDPDFAEAHNHKGGALLRLRRIKEAIESYERAISINPLNIEALNNRNLALNYDNSYSDTQIFQKHHEFGKIFDQSLARFQRSPRPKEKLRIGYVSADFRQHSVNYFFEPVLRNHNKTIIEIYCYHNSNKEDSVTEKLKGFADQWRPIKNLSDEQAAQLINDDEIDILVDLSGHTNGSRLALFGLKPAPIQCTWLGYPNTTGLTTIDYRLTDELTDPLDAPEINYTETLYRIDNGFSCYQGDHVAVPANKIEGPKSSPDITFGCFNNLIKVTDEVISVWSKILHEVPHSRLILKTGLSGADDLMAPILGQFSGAGIDPERIIIKDRIEDWAEHLKLYNEIDIGLDPFPYNGTTTTCEALWMGIPVIVLAGAKHASRVGHSLVTRVGYPELSAENIHKYVTIACELANDPDRLSTTKNNLRPRMLASSLCDHKGFTYKLEAAYQTMWKNLCAKSSSKA